MGACLARHGCSYGPLSLQRQLCPKNSGQTLVAVTWNSSMPQLRKSRRLAKQAHTMGLKLRCGSRCVAFPTQQSLMTSHIFFSDYEVKSTQIVMGRGPDARASGEAWVQFRSEDMASKAIASRDRGHIGGRYVELFPATSHEVARIMDHQRYRGSGSPLMTFPSAHGAAYLKLRGIPYSATVQDVVSFMDGFNVAPSQVAIGRTADGRPSGDAWVQLSDERAATSAMQAKNRASLGGRYVEIFPSNFQEAFRASTTGCGAGSIGVDSYSPVSVRSGASFRSQPYGTAALETGGISSTHPTTPG